jgi:hypothetical protein
MSGDRSRSGVERIKSIIATVAAALIAIAIFVGPPVYAAALLLSDRPLFEVETVTVTQPTGTAIPAVGVLIFWVLVLSITYMMATGIMPRGRRL